jgi:hypothetical protein
MRVSSRFIGGVDEATDLERPRLFLELVPSPLRSHLFRYDGEVTLELLREGEVEGSEICETGYPQVEVQYVVLVRVRKNLAKKSSLPDRG